ncbi:unnamed protein product [Closterium sp. NIES-54]
MTLHGASNPIDRGVQAHVTSNTNRMIANGLQSRHVGGTCQIDPPDDRRLELGRTTVHTSSAGALIRRALVTFFADRLAYGRTRKKERANEEEAADAAAGLTAPPQPPPAQQQQQQQ